MKGDIFGNLPIVKEDKKQNKYKISHHFNLSKSEKNIKKLAIL